MKIFHFQFSIFKSSKWLLTGIIILATILRLWQLGGVPASPDWDEVALGYNAYSILHTGKDEYGAFLPVVLRSFDDYKPALYTYLAIPSVEVLGLNVPSVRLPSALFGILTVLAVYFLVEELTKRKVVALLSSFFLAISPWHIQFSRIAFESNVGLAFNIFGALFFLKGLKNPWLLFLSVTSFVASAYVYQSEKVFSPLILIALILIFRKELFHLPKKFIYGATLIGFILCLPMLWFIVTNKNALERAQGVSVFSDQTIIKNSADRLNDDKINKDYLGLILDNRRLVYGKEIVANYVSHFDLNWLFITGDLSRHHASNMGLLYIWELPFIFIGIGILLLGPYDSKTKWSIFSWFFLAPLAASVTTGVPHAVRALNFLPTYQIFTALGVSTVFLWIRNKKVITICALIIFVLIFILNISYYLDQYFVQTNYYTAYDWQYGYAQAVSYVKLNEGKYKKIVISNQPPLDQSYMFFLFYLQYPPALYQKESALASGGFRENHLFGKYEFRPIDWNKEVKDQNILYIGRPSDFFGKIKKDDVVFYPNGQEAIDIVSGN